MLFLKSLLILLAFIVLHLRANTDVQDSHDALQQSDFLKVEDIDGSIFYLRMLKQNMWDPAQSCYEAKDGKNSSAFRFCYPSINIPGFSMCGMSTLYQFLVMHDSHISATSKEQDFCPKNRDGYLSYFRALRPLYENYRSDTRMVYINGCSSSSMLLHLHKLLRPRTVYLLSIRDLAERSWSAYHSWCTSSTSSKCPQHYMNSIYSWYRSPEMFDQMLISANFPYVKESQLKCQNFNRFYQNEMASFFEANLGRESGSASPIEPLVVSIDGLGNEDKQIVQNQLLRIEAYLNRYLKLSIRLDVSKVRRFNAGAAGDHGEGEGEYRSLDPKVPWGHINYSHYQPMLDSSRMLIYDCWNECTYISELSGFTYNCSKALKTTTSRRDRMYVGDARDPTNFAPLQSNGIQSSFGMYLQFRWFSAFVFLVSAVLL
jgi:hypothetical protein